MTEPTVHIVKIENISAVEAIAIKHQLITEHGLVADRDFTWAWFPEVLDDFSYFQTSPKHMEIHFADATTATFFQLKLAQ